MTHEFIELLAYVKRDAPITAAGVKKSIETYFKTKVVWSVLKEEYYSSMDDAMQEKLYYEILRRLQGGLLNEQMQDRWV